LRVSGSSDQVLDDVLVGEVWLASGQSNMEFQLVRSENAESEIRAAHFPAIRVAKLARQFSPEPQSEAAASWRVCTPETAGAFTAAGYFFAREIHQKTGGAVGIIDATWGGTRVETWTSREALRAVWPEVDDELASIAVEPERTRILADYRAKVTAWEKTAFPQDEHNAGEERGWAEPAFEDGHWRTMPVPGLMQEYGFVGNGSAWFRRVFEAPAAWAGEDVILELGPIDDFDTTYFNGERVGATGSETPDAYQVPRCYTVPGRLVHAGRNVIAVRVFDRFGQGGFPVSSARMLARSVAAAATPQPLDGLWRWEVEEALPEVPAEVYRSAPAAPRELSPQNYPGHLFNGMIAPLVSYGLRGVLWYQGESNVASYATYRARFTALIRDWRSRWGAGTLPFYFVQLAAFRQNGYWPYLREAQMQTLAEPATGMAVAIDAGDARDIHPKNKQAIGHRLALLARAQVYGETDLVSSGPTMRGVEISAGVARVRWRFAAGLRTRGGAPVKGFELAGGDQIYHPAEARIDGESVIVHSPAVPVPATVRYAWADFLDVNLENGEGLPAVPFRTDGLSVFTN
jgi:sialate O-acetylesterase